MEVEIENLATEDSVHNKMMKGQEVIEKNVESTTSLPGSTPAPLNSENHNGSNSDISYQDEENEDDQDDGGDVINDDDCDMSDYGDDYGDDDGYFYDNDDDDDYLSMQAQFDNVDLPPGVEASVSWLKSSASNSNSTSNIANISGQGAPASVLSSMGASTSSIPVNSNSLNKDNASGSSSTCAESSSRTQGKVPDADEAARKYESFKRFDVVDDFSDHHYSNSGLQGQQPSRLWSKKIQDEWRILENDLPDTIYVRVYESRMDLLRAIIVGPQGTPYHDGLFVFDVVFPSNYPDIPPMVYYYSGGLRLNPNLYDCGKVCLSLLNTWTGKGNERWVPTSSTMLQVLVSIQALILNANPFFNEPGYESQYAGEEGAKKSKSYNEDVFILSLKTMMYTLRRPPKHFEDLVAGHFRKYAHDILSSCRAYMDGAIVGTLVNGKVPGGSAAKKGGSPAFKAAVGRMINGLILNFTRSGVPDCERFRPSP